MACFDNEQLARIDLGDQELVPVDLGGRDNGGARIEWVSPERAQEIRRKRAARVSTIRPDRLAAARSSCDEIARLCGWA